MQEFIPTYNDSSYFNDIANSAPAPEGALPVVDYTPVNKNVDSTPNADALRIRENGAYQLKRLLVGMNSSDAANWRQRVAGDNRPSLTQTVNMTDTHTLLGDGETWMPKYETYVPGVNNEERLASMQSDFEQFVNPVKRFGSNAALGALDLVGSVGSLVGAVATGNLETLYDNDYLNWVDKLTERNNLSYKNYYTEAEKNQSLGFNINSWDKVLGGAEFTARMLASEAVLGVATGGLSLGASGTSLIGKTAGKIAKSMSAFQKEKVVSKALEPALKTASKQIESRAQNLINIDKRYKHLNQARFVIMSPAYEAGFEARNFEQEARNNFYEHVRLTEGRDPNAEEVQKFAKKLDGAAQAVFATNMAILAPSNLMIFGDIVGVKNPLSKYLTTPGSWFDEKILKIGVTKADDGVHTALKGNLGNKIAQVVAPTATAMFTEGVYEEGGQGIASGTFSNYVAGSYDTNAAAKTSSYATAFTQAFTDQFTTKSGMEEVIIGALIGGAFGGVSGGLQNASKRAQQKSIADVYNMADEVQRQFENDPSKKEWLLAMIEHNGRYQDIQKRLQEADESGDLLGGVRSRKEVLISMLQMYNSVGKEGDFVKMIQASLQGTSDTEIAENLDIPLESVAQFKQDAIDDLENTSKRYNTVYKGAMAVFKNSPLGAETIASKDGKNVTASAHNFAAALAYSTVMSDTYQKVAADSWSVYLTRLASHITDTKILDEATALTAIQSAGKVQYDAWVETNKQVSKLKTEIDKLNREIIESDSSEATVSANTSRAEKAQKLIDLTAVMNNLSEESTAMYKEMTESFYSKLGRNVDVGAIDLERHQQMVESVNKAVDKIPGIEKAVLQGLYKTHVEATRSYHSFAKMYEALSSPNANFKGMKSLGLFVDKLGITNLIAKKTSKFVHQDVKDALRLIGEQAGGVSQQGRDIFDSLNVRITDEDVSETSQPDTEKSKKIALKVLRGLELEPLEQTYYDKFNDHVQAVISIIDERTDPANEPVDALVKHQARELRLYNARKKALNEGRYTEEQRRELEKFDKEISDLKKRQNDILTNAKYSEQTSEELQEELDQLEESIQELEQSITDINTKIMSSYELLGFSTIDDSPSPEENGIYYHNVKISDTTENAVSVIEAYRKTLNKDTLQIPNSPSSYRLYSYSRKNGVIYGTLWDLMNHPDIPKSLKEDISDHLNNGLRLEIKNPSVRKGFSEVSNVDVTTSSVTVTTKDEEGNDIKTVYQKASNQSGFEKYIDTENGTIKLDEQGRIAFVNPNKGKPVFEYDEKGRLKVNLREKKGAKRTEEAEVPEHIAKLILLETLYAISTKIQLQQAAELAKRAIPEVSELQGLTKELADRRADRDAKISAEQERVETLRREVPKELNKIESEVVLIEKARQNYLVQEYDRIDDEIARIKLERSENKLKAAITELRKKLGLFNFTKATMDASYKSIEDVPLVQNMNKNSVIKLLGEELGNRIWRLQSTLHSQLMDTGFFEEPLGDNTSERALDLINYMNNIWGGRRFIGRDSAGNIVIDTQTLIDVYGSVQSPADILSEMSTYKKGIRRLTQMELRLHQLQSDSSKRFNPNGTPSEKLRWMAENLPEVGVSTFEEAMDLPRPTSQEIERYSKLSRKRKRTESETEEFVQLRDKLNTFRTVTHIEGVNLAELIEIRDQLAEASDEGTQTSEVTDSDIISAVVGNSRRNEEANAAVGLNGDIAVVKMDTTEKRVITNKSPRPIIHDLMSKGYVVTYTTMDAEGNYSAPEVVQTESVGMVTNVLINTLPKGVHHVSVTLTSPDGTKSFSFQRSRKDYRGFYVSDLNSDFQNFLDALGAKVFRVKEKLGYSMIMIPTTDGTGLEPMRGDRPVDIYVNGKTHFLDYTDENLNAANSLKPGDKVVIRFDPQDGFNVVNDFTPDNAATAVKGRFHIYTTDGIFIGTLKGTENKTGGSWGNLLGLRQRVLKARDYKLEVNIKNTYINFPLVSQNPDGSFKKIPIDKTRVVRYGYMMGGKIYDAIDNEGISDVNIDLFSAGFKDNVKRPAVVFQVHGKKAVVPVYVTSRESRNNQANMDRVLGIWNSNASKEARMVQINNVLQELGINTPSNLMSPQNENIENVLDAVNRIGSEIQALTPQVFQEAELSTFVNLDRPFSMAKPILDIGKFKPAKESGLKAGIQITEKQAGELGNIMDEHTC